MRGGIPNIEFQEGILGVCAPGLGRTEDVVRWSELILSGTNTGKIEEHVVIKLIYQCILLQAGRMHCILGVLSGGLLRVFRTRSG
jgi:hypothetical protein